MVVSEKRDSAKNKEVSIDKTKEETIIEVEEESRKWMTGRFDG